MNKSSARSRATQRQIARSSDADKTPPPWLVVAFRVGRDNKRRRKVYRLVSGAWSLSAAQDATHARIASGCGAAYVVRSTDSLVQSMLGDGSLTREWTDTRRGLNRDVDWRAGGTYMERESATLGSRRPRDARDELVR